MLTEPAGRTVGDPAVLESRLRLGTSFLATMLLWLLAVTCGCASANRHTGSRAFDFQKDAFAFQNEMVWVYHFDSNGKWTYERREPDPEYSHHCFVVARSARQFFQNARFAADQPVVDEATYRKLIRRVIAVDPEDALPEGERVVIPGYADLRAFSSAHEATLKNECGGSWHSYFQRGHWRMVFPFSDNHQEKTAARLIEEVKQNRPPVVHVVRFPQLTINHAMLVFGVNEAEKDIVFTVYDPNRPDRAETLKFDRTSRRFMLPTTDYFPGGRVDVYDIYRNWWY